MSKREKAPAAAGMVSLSMEQAANALTALTQLDGYDLPVKDGNGERVVRKAYAFSAGFLLMIAKNITILQPVVERFNHDSQQLYKTMAQGKDRIESIEVLQSYEAEIQKRLKTVKAYELGTLQAAELKLDVNPIPPTVIARLAPILTDL